MMMLSGGKLPPGVNGRWAGPLVLWLLNRPLAPKPPTETQCRASTGQENSKNPALRANHRARMTAIVILSLFYRQQITTQFFREYHHPKRLGHRSHGQFGGGDGVVWSPGRPRCRRGPSRASPKPTRAKYLASDDTARLDPYDVCVDDGQ